MLNAQILTANAALTNVDLTQTLRSQMLKFCGFGICDCTCSHRIASHRIAGEDALKPRGEPKAAKAESSEDEDHANTNV